jgi:predicted Zn-ribbon and HTH transcriptional regulator
MIIERSIINLGQSKGITLPKSISENLNPKDRVLLDIKILEILNRPGEIKEYRCKACNHVFSLEHMKDDIYCPACENENLEVIDRKPLNDPFDSNNEHVNSKKR